MPDDTPVLLTINIHKETKKVITHQQLDVLAEQFRDGNYYEQNGAKFKIVEFRVDVNAFHGPVDATMELIQFD